MAALEVVFEVPNAIDAGLKSGAFQRIGGVIVERDSKQIVAWLRDGISHSSDDLPSVFSSVLASTGAQANVGHILSLLTVGGQVLNLATTAISFQIMMRRLDRLSDDMAKIISRQSAREHSRGFRNALEAARDVFEFEHPDNRKNAMRSAIDGLNTARDFFLEECQQLLNEPLNDQALVAAKYQLILAMHATACRSRCLLANEEVNTARNRLLESLPQFEQYTKQLVNGLLGKNPSIYFHRLIESSDLLCFLNVQQWLDADKDRSLTDPLDALVFFQIVDKLRADFWNPELPPLIEEDNSFTASIARTSGQIVGDLVGRLRPAESHGSAPIDKADQLTANLAHAVILIENYQRLQGFELEIREFRLASGANSFREWSNLVDEQNMRQHGAIILDRERLDRLSA